MRDPVGNQIPATNALKCTFSGVLDIEPERFRESGALRGECPECSALRQLQFRNEVLLYPSHDKRKTWTSNTEQRWAQGETRWEVLLGTNRKE